MATLSAENPAISQPIQKSERIDVVDILRGFALFGILVINITVFAGAIPLLNQAGAPLDRIVNALILVFVESKFFTLFSFLFGIGFAIQLLRAERKAAESGQSDSKPFNRFFRRRLLFLGLFGAAHILFLWDGDILLLYAVVGLILMRFKNTPEPRLLHWFFGLLAVPLIFYTLILIGSVAIRLSPESATEIANLDKEFVAAFDQTATIQKYLTKSYFELIPERAVSYLGTSVLLITRIPTVFAMFVLGLYIGRSGLLYQLADQKPLLRRVRLYGLTIGLGIAVMIGIGSLFLPPFLAIVTGFFSQALAGPLTALGYAATVTLLVLNDTTRSRYAPLASYGRMALTNYILHSVICSLIFYGYGFGLAGKVSPLGTVIIAVFINLVLIGFSMLWLRFFSFGPLEWLWRSLNYQKLQPIRLKAAERNAE